MPPEDTIRVLLSSGLAGGAPLDPIAWRRVAARVAWTRETLDNWREAMREMDERCKAAVRRLSAEEFERLCDEEQAKVDAIRSLIDDVIERDKWPRALYWPGI